MTFSFCSLGDYGSVVVAGNGDARGDLFCVEAAAVVGSW